MIKINTYIIHEGEEWRVVGINSDTDEVMLIQQNLEQRAWRLPEFTKKKIINKFDLLKKEEV